MYKTKKSSTRISYVPNNDTGFTVFHYTKGTKIPSIIRDGTLLTERKCPNFRDDSLSQVNKFDFVWLTTEKRFPWVSYPMVIDREKRVNHQFKFKRGMDDLVGVLSVGLWRIGFPVNDSRISSWLSTKEFRQKRKGKSKYEFRKFNEINWDDYTKWYVSREDLLLDFESVNTLERLVPNTQGKQWERIDPSQIKVVQDWYDEWISSIVTNTPPDNYEWYVGKNGLNINPSLVRSISWNNQIQY